MADTKATPQEMDSKGLPLLLIDSDAAVDGSHRLGVDIGSPTVTIGSGTVDTELTTSDFDTGAGTSSQARVGLVVPASGGPAVITGDASNGLDVDVTRVPTVKVIGIAKRLVDPADSTTELEVKYAKQVVSTDTADFIAGVSGKKILVVSAVVQKQADNTNVVTMKFNNSVANTLIAGAPEITMKNCGDGAVLSYSPGGWFVTSADAEGIDLDITAAENVMVQLGYVEID